MLTKPRFYYHGGRTENDEKTKNGHCKHYYIEVFSRQKFWLELFDKKFRSIFLPREDFHTIKITVFHNVIQRSCAKTATTLLILYTARIEYKGGRTVNGDKTKTSTYSL